MINKSRANHNHKQKPIVHRVNTFCLCCLCTCVLILLFLFCLLVFSIFFCLFFLFFVFWLWLDAVAAMLAMRNNSKYSACSTSIANISPKYSKYVRMKKIGLPIESVRRKMVMDGLSSNEIAQFFGQPSSESISKSIQNYGTANDLNQELQDLTSKYSRMKKVGLPEGTICNKMRRDGIDENVIAAFFGHRATIRTPSTDHQMQDGALEKRREIMATSQLFKQVKSTKEYQETYYYNIPFETNTSNLIQENKFWCDFGNFMLNKRKQNDKFISRNILVPTNNINEILIVLGVLDVPFESDGPTFTYDNDNGNGNNSSRVVIEAQTPTIVFAKQLKPLGELRSSGSDSNKSNNNGKKQSISVHVHYFDANDRFRLDKNGDKCEKFVYKFVPLSIYTCQVVLTNFSSVTQNIQLLSQIPSGSISVNNGFVTKTSFHRLNSYSTINFQFSFYFPRIGTFKHYPFTISKNGEIIGDANIIPNDIIVQYPTKYEKLNALSWKHVSQNANLNQLKEYFSSVNTNTNIFTINWSLIYHRLTNASIFEFIYKFLNDRNMFNVDVWNYSFYHLKCVTQLQQHEVKTDDNEQNVIINGETYLKDLSCDLTSFEKLLFIATGQLIGTNNNMQTLLFSPIFVSQNTSISNGWISYDDVDFGNYSHLEYIPYVNARAHLLGKQRHIVNNLFKLQYGKILKRIINNSTNVHNISIEDKLSLLYYLSLQDRIDDALDLYSIVKFDKHIKNLTFKNSFLIDYLSLYMSLYRDGDVTSAIQIGNLILSKYRGAKLPTNKSKLLKDMEILLLDLTNINSSNLAMKMKVTEEDDCSFVEEDFDGDRTRDMLQMSDKSSSLDFEIVAEKRELIIHYANVASLTVNFYTMNTEVLFSKRPFLVCTDVCDSCDNSQNINENAMFSYISPNEQIVIDLQSVASDNVINNCKVNIPESLKNCNVFIQVLSEELNVHKAFYDNELIVQIKENYGQLKVYYREQIKENQNENSTSLSTFLTKPLSKAYVKVYVLTQEDNHEFYKVKQL